MKGEKLVDTREIKRTLLDINGIILIITIVVLIILFSYSSPHFFTLLNFKVLFESMSILAILAMGVHFLLVGGEIDISFASVLSLSAAVAAVASPGNTFYLILVSLLAALAVGIVNGFFTTRVGIPSFLVTLATLVGVQGIVYIVTDYRAVLLRNDLIPRIFFGRFDFVGDTATAVFWMVGLIIISGIILRYTRFGRWIYSTGGNTRAAMLMGIPTKRVKFTLFIISSLMAGIAGLIMVSRALSARPLIGDGYLMPAIAAPILGGALLTGGRGSIIRTGLGCLLLTIITNGVNLLGFEPAYRDIIMGAILVGALSIRTLQQRGGSLSFKKRQPSQPSQRRE
ncbi:L-arabinose transport system permease protein AraH [subsurface metagenome]